MPQYAILRFSKCKLAPTGALEAHHERKKEKYDSNPDVDTSRSGENFHIVQPTKSYRQEIKQRIQAAGCRTRKDSTMFVDTIITASPEFFKGKSKRAVRAYFTEAIAFMAQKVGKGNIFSAVVHMDEKTPHMHLCFTPITEDGRLSAKEILGNRAQLSRWQDQFYAHMVEAFPDIERGESARKTRRKHIPTRIFKQAVDLSKEADKIEQLFQNVNPFNAHKQTETAAKRMRAWFDKMARFETNMRKYDRTIALLEKENAHLSIEAETGKKTKITEQLELAKLRGENEKFRQMISRLPLEMRQELEQQTQTKTRRRTR